MKQPAVVALWLVSMSLLASCGDASTSSGTDPVSTSDVETTEPEPTAASPTAAPDPTPAGTEGSPPRTPATPPAPTTGEPDAPCTSDAMMPVVAGLYPENELWNVIEVDIWECQNGFARVSALMDQRICDPDEPGYPVCLEDEQVFLEDVNGSWEYFASGTGIDCNAPDSLWPEMVAACEALGLP